jgi:hypothetical protein
VPGISGGDLVAEHAAADDHGEQPGQHEQEPDQHGVTAEPGRQRGRHPADDAVVAAALDRPVELGPVPQQARPEMLVPLAAHAAPPAAVIRLRDPDERWLHLIIVSRFLGDRP